MMQLKNILRLTKSIKDYNLFEIVKKNSYTIEDISAKNKSLKEEVDKSNSLLNSLIEDNKKLKEDNEKIKQTCVNLSHDMLLISKAIGQIYILTEKAVIEGDSNFDEDFCEICNNFINKKKKEEYH